MKINIQSASHFIAEKIKTVAGTLSRSKKKSNNDRMEFRSKMWMFLKDLEGEMYKWVNGDEMEVKELVEAAGYEVEL